MVFVNKVWNGTSFVNTDSDTLDRKHLIDLYERASIMEDSASSNLDALSEERFHALTTGNEVSGGQIAREGFYLWTQKYGQRNNQVAFTPQSIKYRSKGTDAVWTPWKELSIVGHTHTVSHLTDHDTLVKKAGSDMTGALRLGSLSDSSFSPKLTLQTDGVINSQKVVTATGVEITGGTLVHKGNTVISEDGKVHSAVYNDLAEYFLRADQDEYLEPGDLLSYHNGGVSKTLFAEDASVVGVYSDTYGISLGGDDGKTEKENLQKYVPVGLAGRVYTKVIGDVKVGDLITSSQTPGVGCATKHYKPGTIIGKALEEHQGESIDRICVLVLNQ